MGTGFCAALANVLTSGGLANAGVAGTVIGVLGEAAYIASSSADSLADPRAITFGTGVSFLAAASLFLETALMEGDQSLMAGAALGLVILSMSGVVLTMTEDTATDPR